MATQPSPFALQDYKIIEFSYKKPADENFQINLNFTPSGLYNTTTGIFKVKLVFTCNIEKEATEFIKGILEADFKFSEPTPYEQIPPYFYVNSIAIIFPYVRAFIGTLSLQSNVGIVVLPLLNLMALEKPLRDSTKVEE